LIFAFLILQVPFLHLSQILPEHFEAVVLNGVNKTQFMKRFRSFHSYDEEIKNILRSDHPQRIINIRLYISFRMRFIDIPTLKNIQLVLFLYHWRALKTLRYIENTSIESKWKWLCMDDHLSTHFSIGEWFKK